MTLKTITFFRFRAMEPAKKIDMEIQEACKKAFETKPTIKENLALLAFIAGGVLEISIGLLPLKDDKFLSIAGKYFLLSMGVFTIFIFGYILLIRNKLLPEKVVSRVNVGFLVVGKGFEMLGVFIGWVITTAIVGTVLYFAGLGLASMPTSFLLTIIIFLLLFR